MDILEHLPPKPESAYFTALCSHLHHFTQPNLSFHLKVAPEFHSSSSRCSTSGKYWAGSRQLVENLHQDCMCSWATANIGLHL